MYRTYLLHSYHLHNPTKYLTFLFHKDERGVSEKYVNMPKAAQVKTVDWKVQTIPEF